MNRRERLLRQPPAKFVELMVWLHQDFHHEVQSDTDIANYLGKLVPPVDRSALSTYLDELLAREDIDRTDLRALLNRNVEDWSFSADAAKAILVGLRDVLRATG
jgi:hypothetical protein